MASWVLVLTGPSSPNPLPLPSPAFTGDISRQPYVSLSDVQALIDAQRCTVSVSGGGEMLVRRGDIVSGVLRDSAGAYLITLRTGLSANELMASATINSDADDATIAAMVSDDNLVVVRTYSGAEETDFDFTLTVEIGTAI